MGNYNTKRLKGESAKGNVDRILRLEKRMGSKKSTKSKTKALESFKKGMGGSGHNNLPAGRSDSDNE